MFDFVANIISLLKIIMFGNIIGILGIFLYVDDYFAGNSNTGKLSQIPIIYKNGNKSGGELKVSQETITVLNFGIPAVCWIGTYLIAYFLIFKRLFKKGMIRKAVAVILSVVTALFIGSIITMWIVLLIFTK